MNNNDQLSENKEKIKNYYDQEVKDYVEMYQEGYKGYPANLIRLKIIINRLKESNLKNIIDVGCGTCSPMIGLLKEGFKCKGFDFSEKMVEQGKIELKKANFDPNLVFQADLEDDLSLLNETFDAVIASGVFPHITNESKALFTIAKMLRRKGRVFLEFRNDIFSAFTFNKYSVDFFLNRVLTLDAFPEVTRENIIKFFSQRLDADKQDRKDPQKMYYTDILAKFHNPLTIENELFRPCGFSVDKILFYHYHALPPIFEEQNPSLFREASLRMEDPNDWRGYFMASAFVVEATKND